MKNLLSIGVLAFVMMFGINSAVAQELKQDNDRPEVVAKKQSQELDKTLDLTDDQERTVFRALVSNEMNYRKHINGQDASNASVIANKKKFDSGLDAAMKKTLNEAQYKKWKAL
ncbi:hypothetical protein [Ulvibacter antarcticus]|uniref:LTXXQ motif family protein n=1 Tax=Ulvibacter antarcticus TaxID=442714 RepID=A0A3L9YAC9_9FLAO|nr:hypothetical protein [Ulvibacter antarcticus]RMA57673.1 hypothetical protein BXY75_2477 [Ulvibacter antarcticus]